MNAGIPEALQPLFEDYLLTIDQSLPGLLAAFYLEGSLALGAFNERWSDIDFVGVLSRHCTKQEVETLEAIHHRLQSAYPRWQWQGEYLCWEDWVQSGQGRTLSLTYHAGRIQPRTQLDLHTSVTSWTLKHHGLALRGPDPRHLALVVDWGVLLAQIQRNLNTYWASFATQPQRMAWLLTDYGIQWAVLGVLRPWYTLQERDIASKTQAVGYALTRLPHRWHRLIREALHIREQTKGSFYPSRIGRAIEAVRFVRYVIHACNAKP